MTKLENYHDLRFSYMARIACKAETIEICSSIKVFFVCLLSAFKELNNFTWIGNICDCFKNRV